MQIILVYRHVNSVLSKRGSADYSLPLWKKRFLHICTFILIFLIYRCVCSFQPVITSAWFPHWLGSRIKSLTRIHFDIWQSWFYPCCENYFLTPLQPQKWSTPELETQMGTARDVRTQMRTDGENKRGWKVLLLTVELQISKHKAGDVFLWEQIHKSENTCNFIL